MIIENGNKENNTALLNMIDRRYFQKSISIIVNGVKREYVYICNRNKQGVFEISVYSNYFFDKLLGRSLINTSINTKKNFHGNFIVKFLNFIFFDSENKIKDIRDLKQELVAEFLEKYSTGMVGNESREGWKSKDTALDAGYIITRFVYWLCTSKYNNTNRFKLRYIKYNDFNKKKISIKNKYNRTTKEIQRLDIMVDYQINNGKKIRKKVTTASLYIIKCLVEISMKHDPMMTFGIILGAFVGLRQGEVTQMHRGRIRTFQPYDVMKGCTIDLLEDFMLRSDGKSVGNIKIKRKQPVYEAFLPIISNSYQTHLNLLEEKGFDGNLYGAIMIDNKGNAMTSRTYQVRFANLVSILLRTLEDEALNGKELAIRDYDILQQQNLTHHSLRYFYTQYLDELEKNLVVIQYYRGDKSVQSQGVYKGYMSTINGIKEIQNSFYDELKELGWKGFKYE